MEEFGISRRARLVGGAFGILAVAAAVPAYIVGSPEAPSSAEEAQSYYSAAESFVLLNGIVPIAHVVTLLLFVTALATLIGSVGNRAFGGRAAVLAGGVGLATLTAAGFAAEVVYPATAVRFQDLELGGGLPLVMLTLAVWLYHFAQAAMAVMMSGVAVASFRAKIFPAWFGVLTLAFAVVALLHTWIGVWSAWAGLLWILLVSVLMMAQKDRDPVPQ